MDIEILRELFTRTLDAGRILGEDDEFLQQIEKARGKLPPFQIGRYGQLQEWQQDYTENEPGHRHISHLWALFPGTQISLDETPDLAKAARVTLDRRLAQGGGQTGWSRAWVINYWDHLHEAEKAYESMRVMFSQSTFPNLMDTHPPGLFQIDGNLGAANGMLEALVQSRWRPEATEIEVLPALPDQWAEGSIEGVRLRGGSTLDMRWKAGKITSFQLHTMADESVRLKPPAVEGIASMQTAEGRPVKADKDGGVALKRGVTYVVRFR